MDVRTRVLKARLALKVDGNRGYSDMLRIKNMSHYRRQILERGKAKC